MIIGFDLDGVLAEASISLFRVADQFSESVTKEIYTWSFKTAKLLVNPMEWLMEGDEFIIITARPNYMKRITKKWVKRYCPNCKKILHVNMPLLTGKVGNEVFEWLDELARRKAVVINEEKVDIYIDDSSYAVKKLRELCPKVKIINYGGRV